MVREQVIARLEAQDDKIIADILKPWVHTVASRADASAAIKK